MTNKVTKYGLMTIAAVLLVALAFAGAASADEITINTPYDWQTYLSGNTVTDDVILGADIDLSGVTNPMITNLTGTFDGKNHTISNFVIDNSSDNNIGLIGNYFGCEIKDLTLRNFSVSGSKSVGGLVGLANSTSECTFENVNVKFGNVTGSINRVGGLVGDIPTSGSKKFVNCTVENSIIASTSSSGVGGLVGRTNTANCYDNSVVKNCSVSGSNNVGGLVGYSLGGIIGKPFMNGSSVINCVVSAGGAEVGGLVGGAGYSTNNGTTGCVVEKCTVVSTGSRYVGGLVGGASITSVFNAGNKLIASAVRGKGNTVANISGSEKIFADDNNVTQIQPIWLNNNSNANYPKIYIAKSTSKPGSETSEYFNEDLSRDDVPYGAELVTELTGYGPNGLYAALTYVYPIEPEYPITNQTVQGTVLVQNASTSAGIATAKEGDIINVVAVNSLAGYHFDSWNVTNSTGQITVDDDGNFTMPASPVNAGANFKVNIVTNMSDEYGDVEFGNNNFTALKSTSGTVSKVRLEELSYVNESDYVTFIADNTTLSVPDLNGYTKVEDIAVFEIRANLSDDPESPGLSFIFINVTFKDAATATANKDKIRFSHFNTQNNAWDSTPLMRTIATDYTSEEIVCYIVETDSFSPFGIGIYTTIPQSSYTSSSSRQTGSTVILQEGQVAPNQVPTTTPTVAPTAAPTAEPTPATPTVIATEKPTTQATQQSPAPVVGILAGLGAVAVLLRLRK